MKKKILIVAHSSGSLITYRGALIKALSVKNEVSVFTPKIINNETRSQLTDWGVIIYETSLKGGTISLFSDVKYIVDLYRIIRKIAPDIVFPYAFKPVIYGGVLAAYCKIPTIAPMLTGLGNTFVESGSKGVVKKITRNLLRLTLNSKDGIKVILHNSDDRETLLNHHIIGRKCTTYVVNGSGVDLQHFKYSPPDKKNISFLMIARLINAKGIKEYYEAARIVLKRFPQARFRLVGAYDANVDCINNRLFNEISSGEVVEYVGEVSDVRPMIRDCSVVVLPSYREGLPKSVLEGMAMGRAVITTEAFGCRETVKEQGSNQNGFLVPIKNIPILVSKMEYFLENEDDIVRFGLNGRKYAEERFDVDLINRQMLHILGVEE